MLIIIVFLYEYIYIYINLKRYRFLLIHELCDTIEFQPHKSCIVLYV